MNLNNKNVLVVGTGISGIAATNLLTAENANVVLYDSNDKLYKESFKDRINNWEKVKFCFGDLDKDIEDCLHLVVISPGVPIDCDLVNNLRNKGLTIWGEVELAYNFSKGKIVAITGTNGKTTTTALTGEIMKAYFQEVYVVGNIGIPYTSEVSKMSESAVTVAEISSFQLETIHDFAPTVTAILNITPDHLNRHHTMQNYIDTKVGITKNQKVSQFCIINYEDELLRKEIDKIPATISYFSSASQLLEGAYLEGENIIYAHNGDKTIVCNIAELNILGVHNYENVMASVLMAIHMGVPTSIIHKAITEFKAVEHRIEYVKTVNQVAFYNDSKGTNVDAAIKGIKAMKTPTLLIGGGYDKGSTYDEWIQAFDGKVKYLVLLGATKEAIAETAKKNGFHNIIFVDSLEEAVNVCYEKADKGDSVLLSPACASWGMFRNYEERGTLFKEYVNSLK